MQDKQIHVLDDNENLAVTLFKKLGLTRNCARVMIYLIKQNRKMTSKEIEIGTDLGQPQISIAVKRLYNNNMIQKITNKEKIGNGRPHYIISTEIEMIELLHIYMKKIQDEYNDKLMTLDKIQELLE